MMYIYLLASSFQICFGYWYFESTLKFWNQFVKFGGKKPPWTLTGIILIL